MSVMTTAEAARPVMTDVELDLGVEFVPGADLVPGDVIDFFGEFRLIERIVTTSNPLAEAGVLPRVRIALADGGEWQMTIPDGLVPVLPRSAVAW